MKHTKKRRVTWSVNPNQPTKHGQPIKTLKALYLSQWALILPSSFSEMKFPFQSKIRKVNSFSELHSKSLNSVLLLIFSLSLSSRSQKLSCRLKKSVTTRIVHFNQKSFFFSVPFAPFQSGLWLLHDAKVSHFFRSRRLFKFVCHLWSFLFSFMDDIWKWQLSNESIFMKNTQSLPSRRWAWGRMRRWRNVSLFPCGWESDVKSIKSWQLGESFSMVNPCQLRRWGCWHINHNHPISRHWERQ